MKIKLTTIQQVIIGDYDPETVDNLEKRIRVKKNTVHQHYIHLEHGIKMGSFIKGLNIK